jgi:hypothetical protein
MQVETVDMNDETSFGLQGFRTWAASRLCTKYWYLSPKKQDSRLSFFNKKAVFRKILGRPLLDV